jgi:hypothetical protein
MEVHKHPHHVTHKKKWGEYLLEFFMLFLAVFLGFLAENMREHQVEKAKEKEYLGSMLTDLYNDSLSTNTTIAINKILIKGYDSTLLFLTSDLHNKDSAEAALLYFYRYCIYQKNIRINDGTITQLKNNGGLRLLRNKEVINKINSYYNEIAVVKAQETSIGEILTTIDKQAGEIFNYKANKTFIDSSNLSDIFMYEIPVDQLKKWLGHGSPTMLTTDINALAPFMSNISYQMGLMQNFILLLKNQREKAAELTLSIKKAYELE